MSSKRKVEHQDDLAAAFDLGVLSKSKSLPLSTGAVPKALSKASGKDIIKKSTTRQNRYLLVFNGLLEPAAAGQMGNLACLDTQNPVMYVDFPVGRMKLFGTLVFPSNKYITLRLGGRDTVQCEDIFDSMVVFSRSAWIGTAEDNPEEKELPMPDDLARECIHSDVNFGVHDPPKKPTSATAVSNVPSPEPVASARKTARRAAAAPRRYTEANSDEDDEQSSDSDMCEPTLLSNSGGIAAQKVAKTPRPTRKSQNEYRSEVVALDGSPTVEQGPPRNTKQPTLQAFLTPVTLKAASTGKRKRTAAAKPAAEEEVNLLSDDDNDVQPKQKSASDPLELSGTGTMDSTLKRTRRTARTLVSRTKLPSDEEADSGVSQAASEDGSDFDAVESEPDDDDADSDYK